MSSVAFLVPQNAPKLPPTPLAELTALSQTFWLGLRGPTTKVPTSNGRGREESAEMIYAPGHQKPSCRH